MLKKLLLIGFMFLCVFSAKAQEKTDREKSALNGYVKSVREFTAEIVFKNGKPVERKKTLDTVETFDISGRQMTYYTYTDSLEGDEEVLYGDTFIYDTSGKLVEKRTEHSKFSYLCDKYVYTYNAGGKLSEEVCHLTDRGAIGKYVYRYDENGKLIERERIPIVVDKLYFSRNTLIRYKYDEKGALIEEASFVRENDAWKADKAVLSEHRSVFYSNEQSRISTELKYDLEGKLKFVVVSSDDEKGNELETIVYFADGTIKDGFRYQYEFDKQGSWIKQIDFDWTTRDGKSFFEQDEVTYREIVYFSDAEIKAFEKTKPPLTANLATNALQNTDKEEYLVYDALFRRWIDNGEQKNIVVKKFTKLHSTESEKPLTIDSFLRPRGEKSPLEQSSIDDFNEKNYRRQSQLLENLFEQNSRIILASDSELDEFFAENCNEGWKAFYKKYPNTLGMITVSRVGFNKDKTWALVYIATSAACFGGSGHMVILQKDSGTWKVVQEQMLWIS